MLRHHYFAAQVASPGGLWVAGAPSNPLAAARGRLCAGWTPCLFGLGGAGAAVDRCSPQPSPGHRCRCRRKRAEANRRPAAQLRPRQPTEPCRLGTPSAKERRPSSTPSSTCAQQGRAGGERVRLQAAARCFLFNGCVPASDWLHRSPSVTATCIPSASDWLHRSPSIATCGVRRECSPATTTCRFFSRLGISPSQIGLLTALRPWVSAPCGAAPRGGRRRGAQPACRPPARTCLPGAERTLLFRTPAAWRVLPSHGCRQRPPCALLCRLPHCRSGGPVGRAPRAAVALLRGRHSDAGDWGSAVALAGGVVT